MPGFSVAGGDQAALYGGALGAGGLRRVVAPMDPSTQRWLGTLTAQSHVLIGWLDLAEDVAPRCRLPVELGRALSILGALW